MIRSFRALQRGERPRPVLDVVLEGIPDIALPCLMDTGSLDNRFGWWVARDAGLDLTESPVQKIGVGGVSMSARVATVGLSVPELDWEAPVSFCDPWPWDFHLLGQDGFFRFFKVMIDAAERRFEIRR